MTRCRGIFLLLAAGLLLLQGPPALAASEPLPRVALYAFEASSESSPDRDLASAASELLLVRLSNSRELDLLDRSFLKGVLAEKGLAGLASGPQNPASQLDRLQKLPVSDYLVTGSLAGDGLNDYLFARLVDPATGLIYASTQLAVTADSLDASIATIAEFIETTLATHATPPAQESPRLGFGTFRDTSAGNRTLGQGDVLRDRLLRHYNRAFDVYARSEVFPLFLESIIARLQFRQNEISPARSVSLFVSGEYAVNKDGDGTRISLVLKLDHFDIRLRRATLIEGSDWSEIHARATAYLDAYLSLPSQGVSEADRAAAAERYQRAIALNAYTPAVRGNTWGELWHYPFPRWDEEKAALAGETVALLEEALRLDPWNPEARLLLAHTLMNLPGDGDREGRRHLEWLAFHVNHEPAVEVAVLNLRNTDLRPASFAGIHPHPEVLFQGLVQDHYLRDDGSLGWSKIDPEPLRNNFGYSERQTVEIFNVLAQKRAGFGLIRDTDFIDFLDDESGIAEARLRFAQGRETSGVRMHKKSSTVRIEVEAREPGQVQRLSSRQAIDDFAVAAILDRQFYTAQLFLAHTLRSYDEQYGTYSSLVFENVLYASKDDKTRFLAALPIDRLPDVQFTPMFDIDIRADTAAARERRGIVEEPAQPMGLDDITLKSQELFADEAYTLNAYGSATVNEVILPPFTTKFDGNELEVDRQSLAFADDQLLVGLRGGAAIRSGAAAAFGRKPGEWQLVQTLEGFEPSFGSAYDRFGFSLDSHGDLLIVGAPLDDHAVPVGATVERGNGVSSAIESEQQIAQLFERGYIDVYGMPTRKVGTSAEKDIVADFPEMDRDQAYQLLYLLKAMLSQENVGSAYVYQRSGSDWRLTAHLGAPDAYIKHQFGHSVAIEADRALVCGRGRYANIYSGEQQAHNKGGAYVFENTEKGWQYAAKITDGMCFSALLANGHAVVASGKNVRVFGESGGRWRLLQSLPVASDIVAVSESGNYLVIGSPFDDRDTSNDHSDDGAVYVFRREGDRWQFEGRLFAPGPDTAELRFGSSVAVSDRFLAIAAKHKRGAQHASAGQVYLYERHKTFWRLNTVLSPSVAPGAGEPRSALALNDYALVIAAAVAGDEHRLYHYPLADEAAWLAATRAGNGQLATGPASGSAEQAAATASAEANSDEIGIGMRAYLAVLSLLVLGVGLAGWQRSVPRADA